MKREKKKEWSLKAGLKVNRRRQKMKIKIILLSIVFLCAFASVYADIALNIVIANSSDFNSETMPVRYSLPPRIQKNDVLDSGGLNIEYNETEGNYYLRGEITLAPNETKRLKIRLRDIWSIPEEKIESLKKMLDNRVVSITDENKKDIAQLIGDDLRTKLNNILEQQQAAAGDIEEKMKLYSVNTEKLRQIKDKIFSLGSLATAYQEGENDDDLGTVTLIVEARNILEQEATMPIKYYLPKGVIPEYIVDQGDFEVKYDPNQGRFYLHKEEKFQPKETKRFTIEIRNIWHVEKSVINQYLAEANKLNERIAETEAAAIAKELMDSIKENAESITSSQEAVNTVKERIAVYQINQKKLAAIKDTIEKLRSLTAEHSEINISGERKTVQKVMRKIETFSNVEISKLAKNLAEKLKQVGVWRIVYIIVLFLIGVTAFFYGLWFFRLKKQDKRRFEKK